MCCINIKSSLLELGWEGEGGGAFQNSGTSLVLLQFVWVIQHSVASSLRTQCISCSARYSSFQGTFIGTGQITSCSVKCDVCMYETLWSLYEFLNDYRW